MINTAKIEAIDRIEKRREWRDKTPDPLHPYIVELQNKISKEFPEWMMSFDNDVINMKNGKNIINISANLSIIIFYAEKNTDLYGINSLDFYFTCFIDMIKSELSAIKI